MRKNESGRSMVEMLGVLAIIGVLSVTGIAGYSMAMRKYRANQILQAASMLAIMAQVADNGGGDCITSENTNGIAQQAGPGVYIVADATNPGAPDVRIQITSEDFQKLCDDITSSEDEKAYTITECTSGVVSCSDD